MVKSLQKQQKIKGDKGIMGTKVKKDSVLGTRINKELMKEFKVACIMSDTKQSDVIEQAIKEFITKVNGGTK